MLNQVPTAIRKANRQMVTRHPNAMDCMIYRKVVTRTAGSEAGVMGGLPTLGGMGVLENEEETQVDYQPLGTGKVLFGGTYTPTVLSDAGDSAEQQQQESEVIFEPTTEGAFELQRSDLVAVMPGLGVVLPYEVKQPMNTVNIPPYLPKYVLVPQGDLMFDADIAAEHAART